MLKVQRTSVRVFGVVMAGCANCETSSTSLLRVTGMQTFILTH